MQSKTAQDLRQHNPPPPRQRSKNLKPAGKSRLNCALKFTWIGFLISSPVILYAKIVYFMKNIQKQVQLLYKNTELLKRTTCCPPQSNLNVTLLSNQGVKKIMVIFDHLILNRFRYSVCSMSVDFGIDSDWPIIIAYLTLPCVGLYGF